MGWLELTEGEKRQLNNDVLIRRHLDVSGQEQLWVIARTRVRTSVCSYRSRVERCPGPRSCHGMHWS